MTLNCPRHQRPVRCGPRLCPAQAFHKGGCKTAAVLGQLVLWSLPQTTCFTTTTTPTTTNITINPTNNGDMDNINMVNNQHSHHSHHIHQRRPSPNSRAVLQGPIPTPGFRIFLRPAASSRPDRSDPIIRVSVTGQPLRAGLGTAAAVTSGPPGTHASFGAAATPPALIRPSQSFPCAQSASLRPPSGQRPQAGLGTGGGVTSYLVVVVVFVALRAWRVSSSSRRRWVARLIGVAGVLRARGRGGVIGGRGIVALT